MQDLDLFDELMDMKQEATESAADYLVTNRFNITDFTPRAMAAGLAQQKRQPAKARKSGAGGFEDELDESGGEEAVAKVPRRGKMTTAEAQAKLHELQMVSLEQDI